MPTLQSLPGTPSLGSACREVARRRRADAQSDMRPPRGFGVGEPGWRGSRALQEAARGADCILVGIVPFRARHSIRSPCPSLPFACGLTASPAAIPHTHDLEAYPPGGSQISTRQGSQNFSDMS